MRGALRTAGIVAAVVAAAFGFARLAEHAGHAPRVGSEAPELRLPALAGGTRSLGAERGRLVVLNFWASWCPPCIGEMQSLERLARGLAAEGVSVVTVSTDEDGAALGRFVAEQQLTISVLRDPGGRVAAKAYGVASYPETFVIDRAGRILEHVRGPAEWDSPAWLSRLRALVGAEAPAG